MRGEPPPSEPGPPAERTTPKAHLDKQLGQVGQRLGVVLLVRPAVGGQQHIGGHVGHSLGHLRSGQAAGEAAGVLGGSAS